MKTITLELFDINELSETSRNKAIEKYRNNQEIYMNLFNESARETLEGLGFEDPKIRYSLSCSQGDGVSFAADGFTGLEKMIVEILGISKEKTAKIIAKNVSVKLTGNSGRYAFASKSDVDLELDCGYTTAQRLSNVDNFVTGVLLENLEDLYMATCETLESDGYAEIHNQETEAYIISEMEENGFMFKANGDIFYE